ncbi:hypothetical protein NL676_020676 [Syzygium grande]|nr:hypothetical protein NL676_020676 [Syzygium grande]
MPNWGALPQDLLRLVARWLDGEDFVSFGSVCASWRSAGAGVKVPRAALPRSTVGRLCYQGWMAMAPEGRGLKLFNPISSVSIEPPRLGDVLTCPGITLKKTESSFESPRGGQHRIPWNAPARRWWLWHRPDWFGSASSAAFRVYEVDLDAGTWTEAKSLGSASVFPSYECSFLVDLGAGFRLPEIGPNRIYFVDMLSPIDRKIQSCNMEHGKIEVHPELVPWLLGTTPRCTSVWYMPSSFPLECLPLLLLQGRDFPVSKIESRSRMAEDVTMQPNFFRCRKLGVVTRRGCYIEAKVNFTSTLENRARVINQAETVDELVNTPGGRADRFRKAPATEFPAESRHMPAVAPPDPPRRMDPSISSPKEPLFPGGSRRAASMGPEDVRVPRLNTPVEVIPAASSAVAERYCRRILGSTSSICIRRQRLLDLHAAGNRRSSSVAESSRALRVRTPEERSEMIGEGILTRCRSRSARPSVVRTLRSKCSKLVPSFFSAGFDLRNRRLLDLRSPMCSPAEIRNSVSPRFALISFHRWLRQRQLRQIWVPSPAPTSIYEDAYTR